jgi:chitinase
MTPLKRISQQECLTSKLVVGVPFYGHGWEGIQNIYSGLYQPISGPAQGTWAKDGIFDFKDLESKYIGTY